MVPVAPIITGIALLITFHKRSQSKKKPNIWNSASVSQRRMLAMAVLC